ncbi:MAG: hypothetical protein AB7G08_32790 [Hyphomicrobiaceae bacterium]
MRLSFAPVLLACTTTLALSTLAASDANAAAHTSLHASARFHHGRMLHLDPSIHLVQGTTGRAGSTTTGRTSGTSTSTGLSGSATPSPLPAPVQAVPPATGPAGGTTLVAPGPSALQPTVPGTRTQPGSATTGQTGTYPAGTSPSSTALTVSTAPEQSGGTTGVDLGSQGGAAGSTLKDCMAVWEPATHMSKAEWRDTCKRTLSTNFGLVR